VQVDSYRAAYASFLPQDYLARFTYEEQEQDWREWMSAPSQDLLYVAEDDSGEMVGYARGRPGLTGIAPYDSELLALHVRYKHQRQGIGRQLVTTLAQEYRQRGCSSLLVWVAEKNPARRFYERLGGVPLGEQTIHLGKGDITLVEVAYGWPHIESLCGSSGPLDYLPPDRP
jgi:GNAT superfamily N-acetyltransferase